MNFWEMVGLISIGVGIISGLSFLIAPFISERAKLKTELASIYLAPFKRWCAECCGEVSEFKKRYIEATDKYSSVQTINDYGELHRVLIKTTEYLPKIEKEKREVAKELWKLADAVDKFWHSFESDRNVYIETETTQDIVEKLPCKQDREKIAEEVRQYTETELKYVCDYTKILAYLKEQSP